MGKPPVQEEGARWRKAAETVLRSGGEEVLLFSPAAAAREGLCDLASMPYSVRVLLENVLRNMDGRLVTGADIESVAGWKPSGPRPEREIPFMPARVILQDFTGVPVIADLAAMRAAVAKAGSDASRVNPVVPADLVIDHSVQVDFFGSDDAAERNAAVEFERNRERYAFLKWAQGAFRNLRVFPPGRGIVHQVNLEFLATVIGRRREKEGWVAFPDTVLGTDSHTTMVNGMGVLGWGVGGIEAEAVMLGQPYFMPLPDVVGFRLRGSLPEGATATDLVLTVTERLRRHGVTGKLVEFFGPGLRSLAVTDRATVANMAPEYGATAGFFPVDGATLAYLRQTGRDAEQVSFVEECAKRMGIFADGKEPAYSEVLELDMGTVEPSIAGPANPEDRIPLREAKARFLDILREQVRARGGPVWPDDRRVAMENAPEPPPPLPGARGDGRGSALGHGSIVIAAITSCTNTSNPGVMVGAGLLAKRAAERGLRVPAHVKTSLAPGSRVVADYLQAASLQSALSALGFQVVGYGCTTCIGNSGPLPESVEAAIRERGLYTVAVLSGNRNFDGRIHPLVRGSFLMSPMLVVAYALAGRMDIDLLHEPLGRGSDGRPVFLKEIWPSMEEVRRAVEGALRPETFRERYRDVLRGDERWEGLAAADGPSYRWDPASTYIREPPFASGPAAEPPPAGDITGARPLALLGDRITTDHISPAGAILPDTPAGSYLKEHGVSPADFNTYGARRGNHEVMLRGTFANPRLKNELVKGRDGGWTLHFPEESVTTIYEAAERYRREGVPLIILAGKQYGTGSSRDWAAKGVRLLGVRAVIAESYERIHRSNLLGMGVLPLQFEEGQGWKSLGLTGREIYSIEGLASGLEPRKRLQVSATAPDGGMKRFSVISRLDTPVEVEYYRSGGILPSVLRQLSQNV